MELLKDTLTRVRHKNFEGKKSTKTSKSRKINKNFEGAVKSTKTSKLQKLRGLLQPEENSEPSVILRTSPRTVWNYQGIPLGV